MEEELTEIRYYVRVSSFALAKVLISLRDDKEHVKDVCVSLEDDDLLVSFSKQTPLKFRNVENKVGIHSV